MSEKRITILRVLAFVLFIGISLLAFAFRDDVAGFSRYGYPGIFVITLLANATVLIPAPGLAFVFAMGSVFNPLGVALAASTGAALGEMTGYLAGFSGQALIEKIEAYERVLPYIRKYDMLAIIALASIPNPLFDLVGIAAGALKMPIWKFLLAAWIGQLIKMTAIAYAGALSLGWLLEILPK
jgi:membrane protein YqaA with SNARE-associated domain